MPRAIVVDDNEASAKTMGWTLEMLGYDVQLALNGKDATAKALSFKPDVILMDLTMPDISGYDLCKALLQESALKDTIFIAQTGWDQEASKERSREAGFHHYLVKPVDLQKFQTILGALKPAAA